MYTLIIEDNHGRSAAEISFDQGSYTIGRVDGNDVVLSSNSVSRTHARIFVSNNKCYIDDLGSANGVFVDTVQIKERTEIRNGSKIRIGEYTLYLEYKDQNDMNSGQDVLKTQIVSNGQSGYKIVRIMDKFAGEEFMLSEASNTIGRTEDNYILLSDQSISRNHAKIDNKGLTFFVKDLDSSNGTFINNKKISSECQIQPGDIIRFGNVSFVFVPASQRVDITQYAKRKTNEGKSFVITILIVVVVVIGIIVAVLAMIKRNSQENLNANQTTEVNQQDEKSKTEETLNKAKDLFDKNEFNEAKTLIDELLKKDSSNEAVLSFQKQLEYEIQNNSYIEAGNTHLKNKEYEDAINEFKHVDLESKLHSTARESIADATRKMKLDAYNEARSDCDGGYSTECIQKLCDATSALGNSSVEKDKLKETMELMDRMSKNKKNKFASDAKKCYDQLKEEE